MMATLRRLLPAVSLSTIMLALTVAVGGTAQAVTFTEIEFVCPLDGQKVRGSVFTSLTRVGVRLDLRRVIRGSPKLLPLPLCAESKFPIYRDDFSADEIEQIRGIVTTPEYKIARQANTDHFMAAFVAERLDAEPRSVAILYLQASWEAEDDVRSLAEPQPTDPSKLKYHGLRDLFDRQSWHEHWELPTNLTSAKAKHVSYLELTLEHLKRHLQSAPPDKISKLEIGILASNLERRLGRFADAIKHLDALPAEGLASHLGFQAAANQIRELAQAENADPAQLRR